MASHAALAASRIPSNTRFHSKATHSHPTSCFSKRLEVAEFSGLRPSTCVTSATNGRDASFSDVLAAQLSTKLVV
ncbi:glyceraldehyde-3-phosphate dehydrogenase B [Musa troglodytarum]|uniref:Glyceraldehyde-3-phosphate dehydrogenase B n=1 Tax=Musa troglodytarum TaxID=320322 RepID=A0A9E7HIA5_9LILI|nr:glyceraldehyde-3-phosphate dehydrogenase B [Musa troglodytarum]